MKETGRLEGTKTNVAKSPIKKTAGEKPGLRWVSIKKWYTVTALPKTLQIILMMNIRAGSRVVTKRQERIPGEDRLDGVQQLLHNCTQCNHNDGPLWGQGQDSQVFLCRHRKPPPHQCCSSTDCGAGERRLRRRYLLCTQPTLAQSWSHIWSLQVPHTFKEPFLWMDRPLLDYRYVKME